MTIMDDQAYHDEIKGLKVKLKHTESNMIIAATHGKTLLEENLALKGQMASMQKQHDAKVEGLTQQIYNLRSKNEMLHNATVNHKEDVDSMTKKCQALEQAMKVEAVHKQRLNQETAALEAELQAMGDHAARVEDGKSLLERKISEMELEFARQASESQVDQNQKLGQLEEENSQQLDEITGLKEVMTQRAEILEALTKKCTTLDARVVALKEELESKECEASYYANSMERCLQQISDLKAEMSVEKAAEADVNKRGNSLFSEIEDRRQMLEKQATRMLEKYIVMKAELGAQHAQIRTLNLRNASLERNMSHKVDASYAERLEDELATAHREVDTLRAHVKFFNVVVDAPERNPIGSLPQATQGDSEYSFLSVMLAQEKQRVAQQEEEKKSLYNKYAMARDEAQEHRRLLYHKEKVYGGVEAENVWLRAEKEVLLNKCRASGCVDSPEIAASSLQADSRSNAAVPSTAALGSSDPCKIRPAVANGKEHAARSGFPATSIQKKSDCKQQ